jgi:hypothetical protein
MPILDLERRNRAFAESPILIRPGDRVSFVRCEEEELHELRSAALRDDFDYRVVDSPFVVGEYLRFMDSVAAAASSRRQRIAQAAAKCPLP